MDEHNSVTQHSPPSVVRTNTKENNCLQTVAAKGNVKPFALHGCPKKTSPSSKRAGALLSVARRTGLEPVTLRSEV